ncbi:hypothetical protein TNCV_992031 [Trichonephila clavipes]|nr:hypothetical protein TNCV_992031 [Trichonephila clavipes]
MASAESMGGPRATTPHRCSAGCSVHRQCVLEERVAVKYNTTRNHNTRCRTNVAMHNAAVQQLLTTVSPNTNPTIVMLQSLVYADKPQTLDHLEDNIRRVIADIRPQMLEKVIENWTSRLDYIRASQMNITPRKHSKIVALNEHTSIAVRHIDTVVGLVILVFGYHFDMAKKRILTHNEIDRQINNSDELSELSEDGLEYSDDDVDSLPDSVSSNEDSDSDCENT